MLFFILSVCNFDVTFFNCICNIPSPSPFPLPYQLGGKRHTFNLKYYFYIEENLNLKKNKIEINGYNILQIFFLGFGSVTLFWLSYLHLCNHVRYVTFNTDLNLFSKKKAILKSPQYIWTYLSITK